MPLNDGNLIVDEMRKRIEEMTRLANPPIMITPPDLQKPLTASEVSHMQDAIGYSAVRFTHPPSVVPRMWGKSILSQLDNLSDGSLMGNQWVAHMPDAFTNLIEDEEPLVPAPEDIFAIQVAVVAKLQEAGMYLEKIAKQVAESVRIKRQETEMGARDLLEVYVKYSDLGLFVKVVTNAHLSKAVIEVVNADGHKRGDNIFEDDGEFTYDQFEAYQDAVSGAQSR